MAMKMSSGAQTSMSDINITPLVDVMLVLLVIFMVTAPMLSAEKTSAKAPPVDTGQPAELTDKDVILLLDKNKTISFYGCKNCRSMTLDTLIPVIKNNARVKDRKMVYLIGDQRLKFRFVLSVMARLRRAGVPHVGLVTDPSGKWLKE